MRSTGKSSTASLYKNISLTFCYIFIRIITTYAYVSECVQKTMRAFVIFIRAIVDEKPTQGKLVFFSVCVCGARVINVCC